MTHHQKDSALMGRPKISPEDRRGRASYRLAPNTLQAIEEWAKAWGMNRSRTIDHLVEMHQKALVS